MDNNNKRRELARQLDFEQTQLRLLQNQVKLKPLTDPVQIANWDAMVASHEKAIALYTANLAALDGSCG
jgi:hypothetical protein